MNSLLLRAAPLALCLAFAHPALAQAPMPSASIEAPAQLTAAQWRQDLAFMVGEMKRRHPDLYNKVTPAQFDAAVRDLDARIPSLQRNQIVVGLMRIAAMVGDGHTRVDPRKDAKFLFPSMPLKLYLFDDGLFIRAARPDFAPLVGAEVVEIGGIPVAEAIRRTHAISSVDNAMGYKLFAPLYLAMPDILHALGLSSSSGSAALKLRKDGRTWTAEVPAGQVDPLWPPDTDVSLVTPDGWVDARAAPQPLWLQAPLDYHRLVPLPNRNAIYAQVNMITDIEGQSLADFARKIRGAAGQANARAIILDFRLSYGGNHDLRHDFIREMVKAEDEDTRLFVLTARGAFSATEAFLVDLDRLTDAVFVGEPASSKPNSFGDAYRTPLPNSGISIRTSIQFNQLKGQSTDPWTFVDRAPSYRFADYKAGRDPALEEALSYRPRSPLADQLKLARSAADARRLVNAFTADPRNRYADLEQQLLAGGQELVAAGRKDVAVAVGEIAAARFPNSHDAQLVYGWFLEAAGDFGPALQAARRALALEPNSRQGRSLVERMQAKLK